MDQHDEGSIDMDDSVSSEEVRQPGDTFFSPWEERVDGWPSAQDAISKVIELATEQKELAWRGVGNANYSLYSSLYRRLAKRSATLPREKDLLEAEQSLIERARTEWRFDDRPAMEIMAHLQHYGGPTRLLDVSYNPLIALWFAVEEKFDGAGNPRPPVDGRIFAFDVTEREVDFDETWNTREIPWTDFPSATWSRELPRVWRPSVYNERIAAQNGAFLLGGVPIFYGGENTKYPKRPGSNRGTWKIGEVLQATSVPVYLANMNRRTQDSSSLAYTIRIEADAKEPIRRILEKRYGYHTATIYPDRFGLAEHIGNGVVGR